MNKILATLMLVVEAALLLSMGDYTPAYSADKVEKLLAGDIRSDREYAEMINQLDAISARLESDDAADSDTGKEAMLEQYLGLYDALSVAEADGLMSRGVATRWHQWLDNAGVNE